MQRGGFSTAVTALCTAIYILSGHDLAIAVFFLQQQQQRRKQQQQQQKHEPADAADALQGLVAQWYLDSNESFEADVSDPSAQAHAKKKLRSDALEWLAEYQTYLWVAQQNVLGTAPANRQVLEAYVAQCRALQIVDRASSAENLLHQQGRGARKWSRRFRQKWQIHIGKLNTREPCSPSEVNDKASPIKIWALGGGMKQ